MSERIRVLLIEPKDSFRGTLKTIRAGSVTDMQQLLGGDYFAEILIAPYIAHPWHGYKIEDAEYKGLPLNHTAALLGSALDWNEATVPAGPIVFAGGTPSGDTIDVPELVLTVAGQLNIQITEED